MGEWADFEIERQMRLPRFVERASRQTPRPRHKALPRGVSFSVHQGLVWQVRGGELVLIEDMEPIHAANSYRMMVRKADHIVHLEAMRLNGFMSQVNGEMALDALESEFNQLIEADAREWLKSTQLMKALARRAGIELKPRPLRSLVTNDAWVEDLLHRDVPLTDQDVLDDIAREEDSSDRESRLSDEDLEEMALLASGHDCYGRGD